MKTIQSIFKLFVIITFVPFLFSQTVKPAKVLNLSNVGPLKKMNALNSTYHENNLSVSPDGKYLFFMSEQPVSWSTKNYGANGRYDGDIWYAQKINGNWQKAKNLGQPINTPQGEDEPNVSPDGQTVYFESWRSDWQKTGGPYYEAELSGAAWKNPTGLGGGITEFFKEQQKLGGLATDGATFSPDGNKFIFAYGKDYEGDMDIYMSTKNSNGVWSKPFKLSLSTPKNERCPFLAADGKTLYFASDGYKGFGKLDIFKTTIDAGGTNGEVVNIGAPFNTADDDYGFVLTANGADAYFVRNGDIFYADLKNSSPEIKPDPTIILSGIVSDSVTNQPLEAVVKVYDQSGKEIGSSRSNSQTGEYSIVLKNGANYYQFVTNPSYQNNSRRFDIQSTTETEVEYNVKLRQVNVATQSDPPQPPQDRTASCLRKLYKDNFSAGLAFALPLSFGVKLEYDYQNFGLNISYIRIPKSGDMDETKPPEEFRSDNNSNMIIVGFLYHLPITCEIYPFIGAYYGKQYRHFKKYFARETDASIIDVIKEGDYAATHFGLALGSKFFVMKDLYLEGTFGIGFNSIHAQPSGEFVKYEFQYMGWFAAAYCFDVNALLKK